MATSAMFLAAFIHSTLIITHGLVLHSNDTVVGMAQSFDPSEEDRRASMATIMRSMTTDSAMQILTKDQQASAALIASVRTVLSSTSSRGRTHTRDGRHLRSSAGQPDILDTMKMLNTMLHESQKKYDLEQAKCSNYYAKQCAEMEASRGEISATSGAAASCKAKTLSAQAEIKKESKELPALRQTLTEQTKHCESRVNATKTRLSALTGDITVMTSILKMTECSKALLQKKSLNLLHCQTACTAKPYVSFQDSAIRKKLDELDSPRLHEALQETFADVLSSKFPQIVDFAQEDPQLLKAPVVNESKVARQPAPRTAIPSDPCKDDNFGAPASKRASKCTVSDNPNCGAMQTRFLFIQAGMLDERDDLKEELIELEESCEKRDKTLQDEIEQGEAILKDEQTKLAEATSCESTASEKGRLASEQYNEQVEDLKKMQTTCQGNFQHLLNEQCGLKKIRGEVARLADVDVQLQDCEVGTWTPGECSAKCGGGTMLLTRTVEMPANGGTDCLPLQQNRTCNDKPCPIDCKVAEWSEWSSCSAECGGGVAQRARDIETQMKFGGKPCGESTEAKSCNVQACDKPCELSEWTKWTSCSKQCDGGTQKRTRFVQVKATGEGKCAAESSPERLQYKPCNVVGCKKVARPGKPTLQCKSDLDVILVLDGGTEVGAAGWSKTIEAAKLIMSSFQENRNDRFAVLGFSGPTSWSGVSKCIGEVPGQVDAEKDCQIRWATRFSNDVSKSTRIVEGLAWPKGGSLTSLALNAAANELELARKDAKAVVVVITDGRPLSFRRTGLASDRIKKKARLLWVPVSKFAPLNHFKKWASRRWQENVVQVSDYDKLATPETVDHIIADMCKSVEGGVPTSDLTSATSYKPLSGGRRRRRRRRPRSSRRRRR
mmetsp:Transcript_20699/g.33457  ORF Transcript_20699/g.33457 Transcript_20699/m.33457 type:complete len:893 (-) Transcript_20699:95-2773(-)